MNLSLVINFFYQYKFYIIGFLIILLLLGFILLIQWINNNNYINNTLTKISEILFFPAPKSTNFFSRWFLRFLNNNDVIILNNLFTQLTNHKLLVVFSKEPWLFVKNLTLDNNENLTTVIYNNYGIIFIKNTEKSFVENIFNQLSSYYPIPEKIFIHQNLNIDYEDFHQQLSEQFNNIFNQLPSIIIIYNDNFISDHQLNIYTKEDGIDYNYLNKNSSINILKESLNNGCILSNYKNNLSWEIQWKGKGSIASVGLLSTNNINDEFINYGSTIEPQFKNQTYVKFWNKFYFFLLIITGLYGVFNGFLDYIQYKKLETTIVYGNEILNNKDNNQDHQFQNAKNFLNNLGHLNTSRLKTMINYNKDIKNVDNFFSKVYSSSIFNVYEKKFKDILNKIEILNTKISETQFKENPNNINDLTTINYWQELMKYIHELDDLMKEINEIFNYDNPNSIYKINERIHEITGVSASNNYLFNIKKFIDETKDKINDYIIHTLNKIFDEIVNENIINVKDEFYNSLKLLTNSYTQKNNFLNLDILYNLLKESEIFINIINKDIYNCLDENQWQWPVIIQEDIKFLIKNNLLKTNDYQEQIHECNNKFVQFKKNIFSWPKTFLSPINILGSRKDLLNSGDTNIISIESSLKSILSSEIVQIIENNNAINNSVPSMKNKLLYWDLEKLKIIESLAIFYKSFLDQWSNFNNNGFLMATGKIIGYHFGNLLQWLLNDTITLEKFNGNKLKEQKENLESTLGIFKVLNQNIKDKKLLENYNKYLIYQMESIGNILLKNFEGLWFSQINSDEWNGYDNILKAIMGITDINILNNLFLNDFSMMDTILITDILPFMNLIMEQNIIPEDNFPYCINQLSDISSQLVLYKNNQDNDLKNLEKQIIEYSTLKNYDLYKLSIKEGFSNGNIFIKTANKIHNTLVTKAKNVVENQQLKRYNKLAQFFNEYCYGKLPLIFKSKDSVSIDNLKKLKNLLEECNEILFILEKNPIKYKKQIQWINNLNNFFKEIEIINNGVKTKFNIDLQYKDASETNNNLIMRWHTYLSDKETHNVLNVNGTITSNDRWEIIIDIVRDLSISIVEFEKIVPLNRGCLIFSNNSYGLWRFINQYMFKELDDGYLLLVKIPIIIKNNEIEQQWISTYIKINKIPQVTEKAIVIKF